MLDNKVVAVDTLDPDANQWRCSTLLDANAIDKTLEWLEGNPNFIGRLVDKTWKFSVLRHHVEARHDARRITKQLQTFQISVVKYDVARNKALIAEIQRAYFAGEAESIESAELLAYGRQASTDGRPVRVISRHRGFQLIPKVELYFIPDVPDIGLDDNGVYLRALLALNLHKSIRRSAYERIINQDYPIAVVESVKTFVDQVRQLGLTYSLPFATETNDQPMVDKALRMLEPDGRGSMKRVTPHIKLNTLTLPSEESEQKGYHNLMCGVVSAVRNPISHSPADEAFIRERFGNRQTALKMLCLLSLLLEKLDKRDGPR